MLKGIMLPHIATAIEHWGEVKQMLRIIADHGIDIVEVAPTIVRNFCHQPYLPVEKKGPPWAWKYDLSKPNPEYFDHLNRFTNYAVIDCALTVQFDLILDPTLRHKGQYPCLSNNINGVKVNKNSFILNHCNGGVGVALTRYIEWIAPIVKIGGQCLPVLEPRDSAFDRVVRENLISWGLENVTFLSNYRSNVKRVIWSHHGGKKRGQKSKAPHDDGEYNMTPDHLVRWVRKARQRKCKMVFSWLNGYPSGYKRFVNGKPIGKKLDYSKRPWIGLEDYMGILGQCFMAFARA